MEPQPIVGAVVDSEHVETDIKKIDESISQGRDVRLVTRDDAKLAALRGQCGIQARLVNAPIIFFLDRGSRFLPSES